MSNRLHLEFISRPMQHFHYAPPGPHPGFAALLALFFLMFVALLQGHSQSIAHTVSSRVEPVQSMGAVEPGSKKLVFPALTASSLRTDRETSAQVTWNDQVAAHDQNAGDAPQSTLPVKSRPASLSGGEKIALAFRKSFLSPTPYLTNIFPTVYTQLREKHEPQKDTGDRFADGLSRYAIRFATSSTKRMFASGIYPAIFKQDPRYYPSEKSSVKSRILYAATRVFLTTGDNGRQQFNYSLIAGNLTASGMANIWEQNTPKHNRIGTGPTFRRFGNMIMFDALNFVVFKEFGPEIKKKLLRR